MGIENMFSHVPSFMLHIMDGTMTINKIHLIDCK
jgi:hypothetical protein